MNWERKDWIDLLLMVIGACIGVVAFGFGVAKLLGLEFVGDRPLNYVLAALTGIVFGYVFRFSVQRFRVDANSAG